MRLNRLLTVICFPAVVACGGGGGKPPVIIDSPPAIDSPPVAACPVCGPDSPCALPDGNGGTTMETSLTSLIFNLGPGADGMNGTADDLPIGPSVCGSSGTDPCDWFTVPTAGANNGKKSLFIIAGLPAEFNTAGSGDNLLGVEVVSTGGVFLAGTTNFATTGDAVLSAQIFATPMGTTPYDAIAYVMNVSSTTINDVYTSTSGSITTTEISDQVNGITRGTINATNFSETDGMTVGGCTTSLAGLSFALQQGPATFQKRTEPAGPGGMTQARAEAIYQNLQKYLHRQ